MYTEDKARETVCPLGQVRTHHDGNWDRDTCIGAKCMAWRWKPLSQTDENTIRGYARDTSREMAEAKFQKTRQGYCGLSGSPYMGGE